MVSTAIAPPSAAPLPASPREAGGLFASRRTTGHVARYAASLCGVAAVVLFFQPWVDVSLTGIGPAQLSGLQLVRADAQKQVDAALFAPSSQGAASGMGASA